MLFFFLIYCRFNYLSRIRGLLNCSGPILLPFLTSWLLRKNKKEKKVHENIANLGRIGLLHFYDTQIKCCILTAHISHKKKMKKKKKTFWFLKIYFTSRKRKNLCFRKRCLMGQYHMSVVGRGQNVRGPLTILSFHFGTRRNERDQIPTQKNENQTDPSIIPSTAKTGS